MSRFFQILKMDLYNNFKSPVLVGYNTVFFAIFVLILGFLTGGEYRDSALAYNYYAVTILIYIIMNGAMTATNCFMERDIKKANLRIIFSPCDTFEIYFSKILASFLFNSVLNFLTAACLMLFMGLNFGGANVGFLLLMLLPAEFAFAALGVLFCCIFRCEETSSTVLSLVVNILALLGGGFFPPDGLGPAAAAASRLSPFQWISRACFAVIYDGNLSGVLPVCAACLAAGILMTIGCQKTFRTEDYLS